MIDREKVIKGLEETEIILTQAVDRGGEMSVIWAFHCLNHVTDALELLKEQEAVEPIEIIDEKYPVGDHNRYKGYRCGNCKEDIPWDANYCLYRGRKVNWDD